MGKGRKSARTKRPKLPEEHEGLGRLGLCGKCGGELPVRSRTLPNGAKVYERRHLCFICEPQHP